MALTIQRATPSPTAPSDEELRQWVSLALASQPESARQLTIRIVDEAEITALNQDYRNKPKATNVLSFPAEPLENLPEGLPTELRAELAAELGDIAICAAVVEAEAVQQQKLAKAHWAHMTIHGVLHLLGYDHIENSDAAEMEALEIKLLAKLGYSDPYAAIKE